MPGNATLLPHILGNTVNRPHGLDTLGHDLFLPQDVDDTNPNPNPNTNTNTNKSKPETTAKRLRDGAAVSRQRRTGLHSNGQVILPLQSPCRDAPSSPPPCQPPQRRQCSSHRCRQTPARPSPRFSDPTLPPQAQHIHGVRAGYGRALPYTGGAGGGRGAGREAETLSSVRIIFIIRTK